MTGISKSTIDPAVLALLLPEPVAVPVPPTKAELRQSLSARANEIAGVSLDRRIAGLNASLLKRVTDEDADALIARVREVADRTGISPLVAMGRESEAELVPTPPTTPTTTATPAIDAAIAAIQADAPDTPTNTGDPSGGTQADTQDPVLSAFYDNGATFAGVAPQVGPAPTGNTGMEWAPKGWAAPQGAPDTDAPVGSTSSSGSVATSGVTARGIKRAGGVFDQADARADADMGQFNAEMGHERADLDQHVDAAKSATREIAAQDQAHYANIAALQDRQSHLQAAWAEQDQRIRAQGKAEGAAYLSRYDDQLSAVAQLARSSGNPIDDLTRTQALGLAGATFVQGFLATRGININVSGEIDKWVDRSIQTHQQQIANAREAAGDTLHLYEIARQSSQDDAEARTKYRGMVIEGLQSQVAGEAARYQSRTALSRGAMQVAQLDVEKDKVRRELGMRAEQQFVQVHTLENNRAHAQLQASVEMAKIAAENARAKAAAAAKGKPTQYIYGPATLGKDHKMHSFAVGKVEPGSPGDEKRLNAGNDAVKAYEEMSPLMFKYTGALGRLKHAGFVGRGGLGDYAGKVDNADYQEAKALQKQIAIVQTRINNGTRSSDQELQNQLDMIPMTDTLALTQGNDTVLQNFMDMQRQTLNSTIKANSDHSVDEHGQSGLTPEERKYEYNMQDADEPGTAASKAFHDPNNTAETTPAAHLAAVAIASKERSGRDPMVVGALDSADPNFEHHDPHTTDNMSRAWVDAKGGGFERFEHAQPGWAVAADHLAVGAVNGNKDMLESLRGIADGEIGPALPSQQRYAHALVKRVTEDPKSLVESLVARVPGKQLSAEDNWAETKRAENSGFEDEEAQRRAYANRMTQLLNAERDK